MWPLPVGDLFGVGPSAAKRLNSCGIYTIGDLARLERDTAVKLFGSRGDTLWNYANGREADPVTKQRTRDNSYGNSVTMPRDLARPEDADATMLALCDSVGRRLRADGKTAQPYVVDPYPHTDSKLHVRMGTAALAELPPSWYIGVTQMNKTVGK